MQAMEQGSLDPTAVLKELEQFVWCPVSLLDKTRGRFEPAATCKEVEQCTCLLLKSAALLKGVEQVGYCTVSLVTEEKDFLERV